MHHGASVQHVRARVFQQSAGPLHDAVLSAQVQA
jgi:hypothetical protein